MGKHDRHLHTEDTLSHHHVTHGCVNILTVVQCIGRLEEIALGWLHHICYWHMCADRLVRLTHMRDQS